MRSQRLRVFSSGTLLASLGLLACSCGGSGGSTSPTAATPQPVTTNYSYTVPSGSHWYRDYQTTRAGKLVMTLRWNDAAKDLDLFLTLQGCNYWEDRCANAIVGRAELTSGTQEQITLATVQSGTTYTFWVLNYGAAAEEARVEIVIE